MTTTNSSAASAPSARSSLGRALPFVALALAIVVLGLVSRSGRNDGQPLDPRSTNALGTRGLVLLLERFGTNVRIGAGRPAEGAVALLLQDRLNERETKRLEQWVHGGGTLVVADPSSSLAPPLGRSSGGIFDSASPNPKGGLRPRCALPALRSIGAIEVDAPTAFRTPPDAIGCFAVPGGRFLVARRSGSGTIVALGGAGLLVNSQLDRADNAVLAVALLAPARGGVVDIVEASPLGGGRQRLGDLVSRRIKDGLWQLLIAFAVFALWRSRRLGRPVEESQPVQIAGSELVVAVGNLLQQGRRRDAAARMMRMALRRTLSERLGVPLDAGADDFAAAAKATTSLEAGAITAALDERPPLDDAALLALARSIESLRNEVTHAR